MTQFKSNYLNQITDDIYQVKQPLPFALKIINCYLLRGQSGWTIVDTGLNTPPARQVWQDAFSTLGILAGDIEQIVLTHTHPDHFGLAGWLQQFGQTDSYTPPVITSSHEARLAREIWIRNTGNFTERYNQFWANCGLPPEIHQGILSQSDAVRDQTFPHPLTLETVESGETIHLGRRQFNIIHAPGHSDGQIIFYDPIDHLILCGDQVLTKITPNIGLWPVSEPNPLGQYLESLTDLTKLDVQLALPGHGPLINTWHARIDELKAHHVTRLEETLLAVKTYQTPYTISKQLFNIDQLNDHQVRFALAETLSHLELLSIQNQIKQYRNGTRIYSLV
ncbi:MAG: MBL fold metallo-hydrolase [Chloroflexota bacterium]